MRKVNTPRPVCLSLRGELWRAEFLPWLQTSRPSVAGREPVAQGRAARARSPAFFLLHGTHAAGGMTGTMAGCQKQAFRRVKKQAQREKADREDLACQEMHHNLKAAVLSDRGIGYFLPRNLFKQKCFRAFLKNSGNESSAGKFNS